MIYVDLNGSIKYFEGISLPKDWKFYYDRQPTSYSTSTLELNFVGDILYNNDIKSFYF